MPQVNSEPLRVGLIGCGNIAGGYGRSLATRPDLVTIVGAFDIDAEKRQTFTDEFGGTGFDTVEALLENSDIEAVINLTAHHAHAEVSSKALEAGKHVHSEKPLAGTREDGRMLVSLADRL